MFESGDLSKLEDYVKQVVNKVKEVGDMGKSWISFIVGGSIGFGVLSQFFGLLFEGVIQKVKDNIGVLFEVYKKYLDEG